MTALLLTNRPNRPQIRSAKLSFVDLLIAGTKLGFLLVPTSTIIPYPWSNDFAVKVSQSKPGDEILQGRLHPDDFDYTKHSHADLPADPLFSGKTIAEVMAMKQSGELDSDVFVPASQRPDAPLTVHKVEDAVTSAMVQLGAVDDNLRPRLRDTVITDAGAASVSLQKRSGPDIKVEDATAGRLPQDTIDDMYAMLNCQARQLRQAMGLDTAPV
jgi:hypothetical protein